MNKNKRGAFVSSPLHPHYTYCLIHDGSAERKRIDGRLVHHRWTEPSVWIIIKSMLVLVILVSVSSPVWLFHIRAHFYTISHDVNKQEVKNCRVSQTDWSQRKFESV